VVGGHFERQQATQATQANVRNELNNTGWFEAAVASVPGVHRSERLRLDLKP
jgi:hypothetical protein